MDHTPFVLTPLLGRGGLSTFIAFFVPGEVVICDIGPAGFRTSVRLGGIPEVADWCAATRASSKRVIALRDGEIRGIEVRLRMLRHLLVIHHEGIESGSADYRKVRRGPMSELRFGLLYRPAAETTIPKLQERFGSRFQLSATWMYAWVSRVAPTLAQ